jgi:tetratricopeptide (TPR) repeat protein
MLRARRSWFLGLLLVALTVVVYLPAMRGDFLWDDDAYISRNPTLHSLNGLWEIWFKPGATVQYYPLTLTVFWVDYHLWDLQSIGYHLQNVLLHAFASVLLWQVLARLRVPGALLAGAIFALHPVNVMSVAWLTELKNTLSCVLALGAIWTYVRFAGLGVYAKAAQPQEKGEARSKSAWAYYVLSLVLFLLAMCAKTAVSFLPLTLLLVVWWQRERLRWRDVFPLIPIFVIAVAMGIWTIFVERHFVHASGREFNLGFAERVLVSGRSFWFYFGKLFFPNRLGFTYERWHIDTGEWRQYLYPLATAAVLAGLWFARGRLGRGPWVAAMHFYVSTSALILATVLYMMRYSFVADHWQYFGCMSVIALTATGITTVGSRGPAWVKAAGLTLVFGILSALGVLTWRQCAMYTNNETLWRTTISKNPSSWIAHNNLGAALMRMGRRDEAIVHYQKALEIDPDDAEVNSNLGSAFLQTGRTAEFIAHFNRAIEMQPRDATAHANLGAALLQMGHVEEAIGHLQKALEIDPNFVEAHSNLGNAFLQTGDVNQSLAHLQRAVELDPANAAAHYNLADTSLQMGRVDEAVTHLQKVLTIDSQDLEAENSLAWVLATWPETQVRNGAKAIELAEHANRMTQNKNPVFARTLAAAYAEMGRFEDAINAAENALRSATTSGNTSLVDEIRDQLVVHRAGHPFRDNRARAITK